ncbi:hypothetical protein K470DRAFT_291327 [Piedraia hortae CBS 480.64]|uniref:Uncharacterized protein n=1 Tax=Piedraia hortae CBS 480.64 TaxID=1314780 RepID=A0A6A7BRP3_9PEZI|nr:hypothetical protein K470DRAFT_291327 [Piedraia hortae CBS 480.64]
MSKMSTTTPDQNAAAPKYKLHATKSMANSDKAVPKQRCIGQRANQAKAAPKRKRDGQDGVETTEDKAASVAKKVKKTTAGAPQSVKAKTVAQAGSVKENAFGKPDEDADDDCGNVYADSPSSSFNRYVDDNTDDPQPHISDYSDPVQRCPAEYREVGLPRIVQNLRKAMHPLLRPIHALMSQTWWNDIKIEWDYTHEVTPDVHQVSRWDIISHFVTLAELDIACQYEYSSNYDMFWGRLNCKGNIFSIVKPMVDSLIRLGQRARKATPSHEIVLSVADRKGSRFCGIMEILRAKDICTDEQFLMTMTEQDVEENGYPVTIS